MHHLKQQCKEQLFRDNDLFGGTNNVIQLYKRRYIPGQEMYLEKCKPHSYSDIVLNNDDYKNPYVIKLSNHELHKNLFHIRDSLV